MTAEEQAQNQPGINNANSRVGREPVQPGINNANSVVGKEPIQPGINNTNSMVGREPIQPGISNANSMIGNGGQAEKPEELLEAENAFVLYEDLFKSVAMQTGMIEYDPYIVQEIIQNMPGLKDEFSIQVLNSLYEIQEQTGFHTYNQALVNLEREQKNFEEYQRVEEIKAEATARIEDELEENPDISFFDWEGSGLDIRERAEEYQLRLPLLTTMHKNSDDSVERRRLKTRIKNMETLISDTNIALDYDNDIEDLNLTQLVLRAQDMFYNQINALPNDSISVSDEGFNYALDLWKEGGNDTAIKLIVEYVYGGEKDLDDIDLNILREDHYYYNWQWMGEHSAQIDLWTQESTIIEIIEPHFIEAANYQKTDVGFRIELPTNLYFAMCYAESIESEYHIKGEVTDYATIAGSSISSSIPVVGSAASIGISLFGKLLSNHYGGKEDMWDDAIVIFDTLESAGAIDKPFITLEWNEKDSDWKILENSD